MMSGTAEALSKGFEAAATVENFRALLAVAFVCATVVVYILTSRLEKASRETSDRIRLLFARGFLIFFFSATLVALIGFAYSLRDRAAVASRGAANEVDTGEHPRPSAEPDRAPTPLATPLASASPVPSTQVKAAGKAKARVQPPPSATPLPSPLASPSPASEREMTEAAEAAAEERRRWRRVDDLMDQYKQQYGDVRMSTIATCDEERQRLRSAETLLSMIEIAAKEAKRADVLETFVERMFNKGRYEFDRRCGSLKR